MFERLGVDGRIIQICILAIFGVELCTGITYLKISMMAGLSECYNKCNGTQNAGLFLASRLTTNFTNKVPAYGSFLRV